MSGQNALKVSEVGNNAGKTLLDNLGGERIMRNTIFDEMISKLEEIKKTKLANFMARLGDENDDSEYEKQIVVLGAEALGLLERLAPEVPPGVTLSDVVAGWQYASTPSTTRSEQQCLVVQELIKLAGVDPAPNLVKATRVALIWSKSQWTNCHPKYREVKLYSLHLEMGFSDFMEPR